MRLDELAKTEPQALELLRYCVYLPGGDILVELLQKLFGLEWLLLNRCLNTLGTFVIGSGSTVTIHELFQEIIVDESQFFADQALTKLAQVSVDFEGFLLMNPRKAMLIYQQGLQDAEKKCENLDIALFTSRIARVYND